MFVFAGPSLGGAFFLCLCLIRGDLVRAIPAETPIATPIVQASPIALPDYEANSRPMDVCIMLPTMSGMGNTPILSGGQAATSQGPTGFAPSSPGASGPPGPPGPSASAGKSGLVEVDISAKASIQASAKASAGPSGTPTPQVSVHGGAQASGKASIQASALVSTGASGTTISTAVTALPSGVIDTSLDPRGCPAINDTLYTDTTREPPQTYEIQCERAYTGPNYVGLALTDFKHCLQVCTMVNVGFSALQCYGATWLAFNDGIKCLLKTEQGMSTHTESPLVVSGVLLTGVENPVGAY